MKLPTAVLGFVWGPVRLEQCGGIDTYDSESPFKILLFQRPIATCFAITHLQKKSRVGFLLMSHEKWWHLCFHVWLTIRYQQEKKSDGDVMVSVPGSEVAPYFRVGWSRWDAGDCKYVSGYTFTIGRLQIKIPFGTWYGPGLHWD